MPETTPPLFAEPHLPAREFAARFHRRRPATLARATQGAAAPMARRLAVLTGSCLLASGFYSASASNADTRLPVASEPPAASVEPMPFEQPGNSFPGGAYYYLAADPQPAPPPLGDPAASPHWDHEEPGATSPAPARPFTAPPRAEDLARATQCLTAAIYYEAASEPDDGQRAVAQVVLNRLAHPAFPKTVCGVVYQGSERPSGCQFTFTCDGSLARAPARYFWDRARAVAVAALAGYVFAPVGLATHYHTFAVHPAWENSLDFVGQIGAHRFYRFTGAAGQSAAFRLTYAGGEPLPAPHQRLAASALLGADATDPVSLERRYGALLAAQPAALPAAPPPPLREDAEAAYRAAGLPAAANAGAVRPEYENSGRWINTPR